MIKVSAIKGAPSYVKRVEFIHDGYPGHFVAVAGSFNDWDPEALRLNYDPASKLYSAFVDLEAGDYEYKFIIDGEWIVDEGNPNFCANDFGTLNSLLSVDPGSSE
jgi:1,4-alpha-glucan branching enzyme